MAKNDTAPAEQEAPSTLEGESNGWRPEEGDILTGRITAIGKAWSDWTNAFYPLVTVADENNDDKPTDVHAFHHVLQSALMENKPKVGDRISIAYLGKRKTRDEKRSVAVYRVTLPDATGAKVWDSLDAQTKTNARAAAQGQVPPDTDDIPTDDIPF